MAKPKRYPNPPSRTLERHGSGRFWWYADGPVEVLVGDTWIAGEEGEDDNGVAGYAVHLSGPDAGAIDGAHQLAAVGANRIPSRRTGAVKPAAVDVIQVY